ncbi:hypothetical protein F4809DRAFT_588707 [Biscogniauxia mediterranea]|nr:hypothetical protein F4809DRAFT_588707 [Biscogniauxia mediterranea]
MCLFVNAEPVTRMMGFREVEAQMLLEFLMRRVVTAQTSGHASTGPRSRVLCSIIRVRCVISPVSFTPPPPFPPFLSTFSFCFSSTQILKLPIA